jgi:hypothetical protein
MSQFVDHTALILDGSEKKPLQQSLNEIDLFLKIK